MAMTNTPRRRGRPPTGENTKVIRVPKDFDRDKAIQAYYEWLPVIEKYAATVRENPKAVRNEKLIRLLEELGVV